MTKVIEAVLPAGLFQLREEARNRLRREREDREQAQREEHERSWNAFLKAAVASLGSLAQYLNVERERALFRLEASDHYLTLLVPETHPLRVRFKQVGSEGQWERAAVSPYGGDGILPLWSAVTPDGSILYANDLGTILALAQIEPSEGSRGALLPTEA